MKTLQELYNEIIASSELKAAFTEAAKSGKTEEFLKTQGCEATAEELAEFLKNRASGELSDAELDSVGGGCDKDKEPMVSAFSFGVGCITLAIASAATGHVGQKQAGDKALLCNPD